MPFSVQIWWQQVTNFVLILACAMQLCAEKRQHSAALEEYAGLQQQVSELEVRGEGE